MLLRLQRKRLSCVTSKTLEQPQILVGYHEIMQLVLRIKDYSKKTGRYYWHYKASASSIRRNKSLFDFLGQSNDHLLSGGDSIILGMTTFLPSLVAVLLDCIVDSWFYNRGNMTLIALK